jgi:3'-5' exoribonuclease
VAAPVHRSDSPSGATTIIGPVLTADAPTIATLRPGEEVDAMFACARKDRLQARSGLPYLALELRDRSGAIQARAFRDADVLAGRFERGDLVRVRGRVERFRDELQVEVRDIARAEAADPAAFLPVAYRDLDELDGFLEHLAREVHDPGYAALLERLLADGELRAAWRRAPCTRAGHHAYLGGLLEHTVAVGTLALETVQLHPRLNSDLLLCAALVHDLGKTREFTYGAAIELSDEGRLLGHIALGQRLLEERMAGLDAERRVALLHCVLCHHGPDAAPGRRFGSPEALALYRLNAVDASVKGALEHGLTGS